NEQGIPLTTTHSNIHYHLALALYLQGRYAEALEVHDAGRPFGEGNDDQKVSRAYWRYRAMRELGRDADARAVLDEVLRPDMTIIENHAYLACLEAYRSGDLDTTLADESPILGATFRYGIAAEHLADGERDRAIELLQDITSDRNAWPAFGFIAAETMLDRLR
ncbi:MAG: hypothetical protein KDA28_03430, partial [Phycisphaerales bacterium]|nr:hypothetical protein [Phycisphaerales bacterium]